MLAIDTNIVVRYLVGDDPVQFRLASKLIENNEIFVPLTVIIESEWVLRASYRFTKSRIQDALQSFLGLPRVTIQHSESVSWALQLMLRNIDLADALHLAQCRNCDEFFTFDRALSKMAAQNSAPVVSLLCEN